MQLPLLLVLALGLTRTAQAQSDPVSEAGALKTKKGGNHYELTDVNTKLFELSGGWLIDLGVCSAAGGEN